MTRRQVSLLDQMIRRAASAGADAFTRQMPRNHEAMRQTLESVLHAEWSQCFGGERVRVWTAKRPAAEREARKQRIINALRAGMSPMDVARRESVSERWVRKVRAELTGP